MGRAALPVVTMSLKRRYTIERASTPLAPRRFLAAQSEQLVWAPPSLPIRVWKSAAAASWFQASRMGLARADAVVVEHAVH